VKKICDLMEKVLYIVGMASVAVFFVCTTVQVCSRVFGFQAAFTEEVANAALAWCCFIGSAPMVRSNEHFKFTALTEKLKGKSLFADELAGHVFVLIFNLVVGIYGIKLVQQFAAWKMTSMPVSKGWSWLCVPIFGLTAAVFSVENIIDCIKHPDRGQVEDAVEKAMKEAEVLVAAFLVLLFAGIPIAYILGLVALLGISQLNSISLITVVQKMFTGLNSFTLLAVPLFVLAANIMNRAKISEKLIQFCNGIVGRFPGGLAYANVLVSMLFAGISGSSQADTAGIGSILIPAMEEEGYNQETSVGVTAASSTIGIVIPPSIPMVVYSSVAGASIGALFLGGVVPGILIGLGQMFVIFMGNKKYHYPKQDPMSFKDFLKLAIKCLPPVLTPVIIIGGVIGGLCTATESAAIACIYAIILGVFVFKNLSLKDVKPLLYDTLRTSATSLFALATANALGQLLSYYNVSTSVQQMFATYFPYKWQFLLAVIGFYLFLGTFMDAIPAMILFVPVLMPVATAFGITPVQLGLIIVITLAVGQVTPPYGLCLLIAGRISGMSVQKSFKAVIPYIMVSVVVVVLIAFLPDIAFALPKLIKPEWF